MDVKATFLSGASPINSRSPTFLYRLLLIARLEQDLTGANRSQLGKTLAASLASEGSEIPVSPMGPAWMSQQDRVGLGDSLPSCFPTAPPSHPSFAFSSYRLHGVAFLKVLREGGSLDQFHK